VSIPEYTITNQTLQNIAQIEYAKAIIENTTLLQNWQDRLHIEAKTRIITFSFQKEGFNVSLDQVSKQLNKMPVKPQPEIKNYEKALSKVAEFSIVKDFDEKELKELAKIMVGNVSYRSRHLQNATNPQEILAEMTKLMDWYNSLDARQTHPLILAAIFKAKIEEIKPFATFNSLVSDLCVHMCLQTGGYGIKGFYALEEYYYQTRPLYQSALLDAFQNEDYTKWLEYFTDGFNRELSNIAENVKILARDARIAKAAGTAHLNSRQERLVTYLQDYGMLQNKDFHRLFPDLSEDTVLRELKNLMNKGIVVKRGSTKSSRYELN
jgi:Fic family protein